MRCDASIDPVSGDVLLDVSAATCPGMPLCDACLPLEGECVIPSEAVPIARVQINGAHAFTLPDHSDPIAATYCFNPAPVADSSLLCGGSPDRLLGNISDTCVPNDVNSYGPTAINVIGCEGDLASEENTLISPEHYREFIKPYQIELVEFTHQKGMKILKHSDGNMWPILEDHIEVGFDGFHPIQSDCMDISEVKRKTDGNICLIGNIDCRALLCEGSEKEVEATVKKTIEIAAPEGGFMLMSSNSIHAGVKPENYIAMVKAGHEYGVYS